MKRLIFVVHCSRAVCTLLKADFETVDLHALAGLQLVVHTPARPGDSICSDDRPNNQEESTHAGSRRCTSLSKHRHFETDMTFTRPRWQ